ncbi:MAG: TonB-dependent receptor [Chitinophaga sp.]|uniref:TonB-dependent receptor n=1 Tax=Chitinophaga sp. TaxID=1869181 RepID=UPI0025B82E68|nr:TonB-dependent receptor [Chitinophaga sp.]MBV8254085.1 TonB-dependent receptor [Chitinophaga sp.]
MSSTQYNGMLHAIKSRYSTTLRVAKLTAFLLVFISLQVVALGYSQTLTLHKSNAPITEIFKSITQQSGYNFMYRNEMLSKAQRVTISVTNVDLKSALDACFQGQPLTYSIVDKVIVVDAKKEKASINVMQTIDLKGQVVNEKGESLPGASVVLKGTTKGAMTDAKGEFQLKNINPENGVLVVNYIGFEVQEVSLQGRSSITITLKQKNADLTDVVVVGYATQKRVNLTGAVATVTSKSIENRPVTNVSSALAGLSPGLQVRQSSGKPGSDGATIRVRGVGTLNNSDPLVVIDGIIGSMDAVNPTDIESISVLKDAASSSIYGTLAANGVILITTKKGSRNRTTVTYSGTMSTVQPSNLPKFVNDYVRYMKLYNESARNLGQAELFKQSTIDTWVNANQHPNDLNAVGIPNSVVYANTDWSKTIFKHNILQQHNVSVAGGGDKSTFLLSAGYQNNPGTMDHTEAKRYQLRLNVNSKINNFITVGTQTFASQESFGLGNTDNAFNYLRQTTPGVPAIYDGKYGFPSALEESQTANNILLYLNNVAGKNVLNRFNSTVYATISILKGLTFETKFNYQTRFQDKQYHDVPFAKWDLTTNIAKSPAATPDQLTTSVEHNKDFTTTFDNVLRYSTSFKGGHDFSALVGYNQNYYYYNRDFASRKGLISQDVTNINVAGNTNNIFDGTEYDNALRSWFGRVNYAYRNKYLFEANLRRDGSSRFAPASRWGYYPSFSAGWRLTEEGFLKDALKDFQQLKLRGSWGKLGNNGGGDRSKGNYDWQTLYNQVYYSFNNTAVNALAVTKFGNPFLLWEATAIADVGVDATFLNNTVNVSIDYYNKTTTGIITTPPIPLTVGNATAPTVNTATVNNKGIEVVASYNHKFGEVDLTIGGNFSYNKNVITKYQGTFQEGWTTDANGNKVWSSNIGKVASSSSNTYRLEGHQIDEYYVNKLYSGDGSYYKADGSVNKNGGPKDGMVRTPKDLQWVKDMMAAGYTFLPSQGVDKGKIWYGDFIYADTNGDGVYGNNYDRTFTGTSATPKYNYGFNLSASWKGFYVNMIWAGSAGFQYYYNDRGYLSSVTSAGNAIGLTVANDHYYYNDANPSDPANNINATYPRLKLNTDPQNSLANNFYLYNASYLKLKNLQIGYQIPESLLKRASISKAIIYVSGENLLTITKYPGLDPEIGPSVGYPTMKQYALGLNVTF